MPQYVSMENDLMESEHPWPHGCNEVLPLIKWQHSTFCHCQSKPLIVEIIIIKFVSNSDNLLSSELSFVNRVSILLLSGFTRLITLMTPL